MNVKKTKKFKENHPENYHVHDTHMGLLHSPEASCQNARRFVGSDKVTSTFGVDGMISQSTCMVLDQGVGFVKVMRPKVFTHVC